MAQGTYLVTRTSEDCAALLRQLEQAKTTAARITQRMEALGIPALQDYVWPDGYSQDDFVALYRALDALPGSIVNNLTRDALFKIVSSVV